MQFAYVCPLCVKTEAIPPYFYKSWTNLRRHCLDNHHGTPLPGFTGKRAAGDKYRLSCCFTLGEDGRPTDEAAPNMDALPEKHVGSATVESIDASKLQHKQTLCTESAGCPQKEETLARGVWLP